MSLSRRYLRYSGVMGAPSFLVLSLVRYRKMSGRNSMCLWMFRVNADSSVYFLSKLMSDSHSLLKFLRKSIEISRYRPWSSRTICGLPSGVLLTRMFPGWASQWTCPNLNIICPKMCTRLLATTIGSSPSCFTCYLSLILTPLINSIVISLSDECCR